MSLEEAIRDSRVHIPIFSSGYASSPWCLKELSLMWRRKATCAGTRISPMFYDVEPCHVRYPDKEGNAYAEAFKAHRLKGRHSVEEMGMEAGVEGSVVIVGVGSRTDSVRVVTDAAPVCQRAGKLIENTYRHIYWTPCCVHALNNALKDIGKIDWVKAMISEARELQMFICNHHTSLALFRSFSKKEFIKPGDTRYATYFILLERMIEVQQALQSMVICTEWKKWPDSSTEEGKRVRDKVLDESWWSQAKYIVSFIAPIVAVIRYADTDSPNLGEIYETFDSMLGQMKEIIAAKDPGFYESYIRPIIQRRWDKMNTPLHMAAYALNPKWYVPKPGRMAPNEDREVKDGFMAAVRKMYLKEEASTIRTEWLQFVNLRGPRFSQPDCLVDLTEIAQSDPRGWWDLHGDDTPNLQHLAVRLLSQVGSSSAAERNWSTYSFIHSLRRSRLTSRRAEKLVAVHSSLRLRERVKPEYRASPATRWDVDPEDARQVDDEEDHEGILGVPLDALQLDDAGSSSDSLGDDLDILVSP